MFNEAGLGETAASPRFLCSHSQRRHISHDHDGEFSGEGKDLPAVYLSLHVPWSCGQCRGVWEGGYPALLKDGCYTKCWETVASERHVSSAEKTHGKGACLGQRAVSYLHFPLCLLANAKLMHSTLTSLWLFCICSFDFFSLFLY